ncbi:MAG: SemiSWEET transporter [Magnetococcales bacterium]|nr:SemiSWEET transporter [Magnetococcales bacterium]
MEGVEILGYLAGFLTAGSFLPQALQTWKTRSTQDISLGMFVIYVISTLMWIVYGFLIQAWPLMAANGAILVMATFILFMKLQYK